MTRLVILCLLAVSTVAHADPKRVDAVMAHVRELFERNELAEARKLLLDTYATSPRPDLLFALGQVEVNLGHYAAAIQYYERFLATGPSSADAALAQQAIGAAREAADREAHKPAPPPPVVLPPPPPPRRVHRWDRADTVIAAIGGAVVVAGAGVGIYGYEVGTDRSGTLTEYDDRVDRSLRLQKVGVALCAGGALVAVAALVRWRVKTVEVVAEPRPDGAGVVAVTRW
jgi:tetratricopeptide (TPR) repeat protein